jgi:hypothetical protein
MPEELFSNTLATSLLDFSLSEGILRGNIFGAHPEKGLSNGRIRIELGGGIKTKPTDSFWIHSAEMTNQP